MDLMAACAPTACSLCERVGLTLMTLIGLHGSLRESGRTHSMRLNAFSRIRVSHYIHNGLSPIIDVRLTCVWNTLGQTGHTVMHLLPKERLNVMPFQFQLLTFNYYY